MTKDPVITFGKHKGRRVSEVPLSYARWLSFGEHTFKDGTKFTIDKEIAEAADERIKEKSYPEKRLMGAQSDNTEFIVQYHNSEEPTYYVYNNFSDAFKFVTKNCNLEDDRIRILVWEVLPAGHKKCVMRYSGPNWSGDDEEFVVENYYPDDWEEGQ